MKKPAKKLSAKKPSAAGQKAVGRKRSHVKAAARGAKNPPSIRVRLSNEEWDMLHRHEENWSEICRQAMVRRAKSLDAARRPARRAA